MARLIIEAKTDDLDFALRAARFAMESLWKEAVISYANESGPDFYIKRNKKSISIRAAERAMPQ